MIVFLSVFLGILAGSIGGGAALNPLEITFGFNTPQVELMDFDDLLLEEGDRAPRIVIEKVVSFSEDDSKDMIVLRNIGGQTFDLTGWRLTDAEGLEPHLFGEKKGCESFSTIPPGQKMIIEVQSVRNPCGFPFSMSFKDEISLISPEGKLVGNVGWDQSQNGMVIQRGMDGKFGVFDERKNILEKLIRLEAEGKFSFFLEALNRTGLSDALSRTPDPNYDPAMILHAQELKFSPQFPSWFGYPTNRSDALLDDPLPFLDELPTEDGIPVLGPYTVFLPTDEAFEQFRIHIAGPDREPPQMEYIMGLPQLRDILLYHIAPGLYTSDLLSNKTVIQTARDSELVSFTEGGITEGKIMLNDACLDKPTPDGLACEVQKLYGKCDEPFMRSRLGAQWIGGFCQRTCDRCYCGVDAGGVCATVVWPDLMASNGVIHGIDRLLFPPPVFDQEESPETELPESTIEEDVFILATKRPE
ncbi:hypothetical protein BSKO_12289 [Bryopsis sp. KO-2023]|nr:hypothetical protein BSKO_12289 [Bryopsis sp. KO-2023]